MPEIRILETCLYAEDIAAAERFYSDVLGLELISREGDRHVFFRCGPGVLLIFNPGVTGSVQTRVGGAEIPLHGSRGPGHVAFSVEEDRLSDWSGRLRKAGVSVESEVEWPRGGRSIYFRDPAGNSLEFASPRIWYIE